MNTNMSRIIPAVTEDGLYLDIPRSAWNEIEQVAQEEFSADLTIAFQPTAGRYLGGPEVPFAHYLLAATLDQDVVEAFIARIDPLINDVVERHTQLPVSAGR
jgi:hypothetical protein